MNSEVWQAAVHRVPQSWTLCNLACTHPLSESEREHMLLASITNCGKRIIFWALDPGLSYSRGDVSAKNGVEVILGNARTWLMRMTPLCVSD